MRNGCIRVSLLTALIGVAMLPVSAQVWDATKQARSWAKQDKDDSFTFYEPTTRTLHTWTREAGLLGSLPIGKLDEGPERWVMDPRNCAWIAHGLTLSQIDRSGRVALTFKLPATVGDISWDAKGFVISYRTSEPYLEKRDFKGLLLWSFGAKPIRDDGRAFQNRRPIVQDESGKVFLADSNTLNLSVLDGNTGRKITETNLTLAGGQPAPFLEGSALERSPLALWAGKGVVFAALKAAQLPGAVKADLQGLVLARIELATSRVEFLSTGLDETYVLVGVLEDDAIFTNPRGGLLQVKIK